MPIATKPLSTNLFARSDIERFHASYERAPESQDESEDQCWGWQRHCSRNGYGRFRTGHSRDGTSRAYCATRLMYFFATGEDPGERLVCHSCDNPGCCNPKHLFLGDHAANMQDMASKGRAARCIGVRKIDQAIADRVRADARPYALLCADYGLSKSNISEIKTGKIWNGMTHMTHVVNEPNYHRAA